MIEGKTEMKFLFAGLGGIGQRHLRNLHSIYGGSAEYLAFQTRNRDYEITDTLEADYNANVLNKYGVGVFDTLDSALSQGPDVVFVTNPTSLHIATALAAARNGAHVFIEKPISHNLHGVTELAEEVAERGSVAYVGYQLRFHPGFARISEILSNGLLGNVLAARIAVGSFMPNWHPYEDFRELYASRSDLGGGVLLTESHETDLTIALFGMPNRAFASGGSLSGFDLGVEDTVSLILEYEMNERILPVHLHLSFCQQPPVRRWEIYGEEGTLVWDYFSNTVEVHSPHSQKNELSRWDKFDRNQMFLDELKHFLSCIGGAARPVVSVEEAAKSLKVVVAAKLSLESGTAVKICDVT